MTSRTMKNGAMDSGWAGVTRPIYRNRVATLVRPPLSPHRGVHEQQRRGRHVAVVASQGERHDGDRAGTPDPDGHVLAAEEVVAIAHGLLAHAEDAAGANIGREEEL